MDASRRGRVEDEPWAATLAAHRQSGRTGQITIRTAAGKVHAIAFTHGVIVGATSPLAVDSLARIASSLHLPAAPVAPSSKPRGSGRDRELEAYITETKLAADQVARLKRQLLLQRAARTFAIESGAYTLEDRVTIPVVLGVEVDVRAVIFAGALLHVDGGRMTAALAAAGGRFVLAAGERDQIARFELGEVEAQVVAELHDGTSIAELEAKHRDIDPRRALAVFYALAACGAIVPVTGASAAELPPGLRPFARGSVEMEKLETQQGPKWVRLPSGAAAVHVNVPTLFDPGIAREIEPPEHAEAVPMLIRADAEVTMHAASPGAQPATTRAPAGKRAQRRAMTDPFLESRPTVLRPNALPAAELHDLIVARTATVDSGADYFEVLGVDVGAGSEGVRAAFIELTRNLRSERLIELELEHQEHRARKLVAQIYLAYTVLTDPARRADYVITLANSAVPLAVDPDFAELADEAFERGAASLRADDPDLAVAELRTATELVPNDIRYLATLGQAEFAAAAAASRRR